MPDVIPTDAWHELDKRLRDRTNYCEGCKERQARIAQLEAERDGARKALDYLMSDPAVPAVALDRTRQLMQHYGKRTDD